MSIETTASNLYYYFKFLTSAYKYGGKHATKQIRFFVGLTSHGRILSEAPSAISQLPKPQSIRYDGDTVGE